MAKKEESNPPQPYIPAGRYSHVAATIDSMLYVWGGWRKDAPKVHSGAEKIAITSTVDVLDLQDMEWMKKKTTGDPPLGVSWCAFTVVGKRIIIYGGYCQHGYCYHNSLHELDTSTDTLTWKQLADDDEPGAPMKKWDCGLAAFSGEMISVFGGYGDLKRSQTGATYVKNDTIPADCGWTNEIHCFKSGKWSSPSVTGERPHPICGFSYVKTSESDVAMFGGCAKTATSSHIIDDLYILRFTDTTTHCIKVTKPAGSVQWPVERNYHSSCVLSSQANSTQILTIGGEGNERDQNNILTGSSFHDVWIGDVNYTGQKITWKEVTIPADEQFMRQRHSATAWRPDASHAIVVVYGGLESTIRDKRNARQQDMTNDTRVLEFELETRAGKEVWVLLRAVDLACYKKSAVVKLRKRVRDLEQEVASLKKQTKCAEGALQLQLSTPYPDTPDSFLTSNTHPLSPDTYFPSPHNHCLIPLNMETLLFCTNGNKSVRVVNELAPDWRTIGCFLRFPEYDLEAISKDNQSEEDRCRRMLSMWVDGRNDENDNRPKTWATLIHVIKRARRGRLSKQIQEVVYANSDQI